LGFEAMNDEMNASNRDGSSAKSMKRFWILLAYWCLLAGVIGGFFVAYFMTIHREQTAEISKLEKRVAGLGEKVQELEEIATNLEMFKKKVEFLREKLTEKRRQLPTEPSYPDALEQLRSAGKKSGLSFLDLIPDLPGRWSCYTLVPIKFRLEGDAKQIAQFCREMGYPERIMNVEEMTLFRHGKEPHIGSISAYGTILAYSFKGPKCVRKKAK
jgi:Tfp pilus assembly protein PilO